MERVWREISSDGNCNPAELIAEISSCRCSASDSAVALAISDS